MSNITKLIPWLAFALLVTIAGCGGTSTLPYVGGPFTRPDAQLFSGVVERARSQGYLLEEEDAARGRFSVQAHTTGSRGQTAHFIVQCYQPGWFQVTAEGSAVRRHGEAMTMSGDLFGEYQTFSMALVEGFLPHTEAP